MKTNRIIVTALTLTLTAILHVLAIEGLKLQVRCPDVVLSWPSADGETYIVQHRETLTTNTPWVTLTNSMPADTTTNITSFVHSNRVDCPAGQVFGMMRSSGGGNESSSLIASADSVEEAKQSKIAREAMRLLALEEKCKIEGRAPYDWELNNLPPPPPTPEQVREKILNARINASARLSVAADESINLESEIMNLDGPSGSNGGNGPQPDGAGGNGGSDAGCGFYRVVRNGLHLSGVTNEVVLSGTAELPYELGVTNSGIPHVKLFSNGNALPHVASETNSAGQLVLRWNTAFTANGTYDIYAHCDFNEETIVSVTNTVIVTNLVHFVDFTTAFGDQMWVYAELAVPVADVLIDIFTEEEGYIGSFSDSTTDGVISFAWNLVGPSNQVMTNETIHGVVNVGLNGNPPASTGGTMGSYTNPPPWMTNVAHIKWNRQNGWFSDKFVVAWGAAPSFGFSTGYGTMVQEAVVDVLASPAADFPYTLNPENTFNGNVFRLTPFTRTNLLNYLADTQYRNFFYYGHGHGSAIGDLAAIVTSDREWSVKLEENDIRAALGNPVDGNIRHPYRFVFLHTCNSAEGTLCEAFGIDKLSVSRSIYANAGRKARAFVGFQNSYNFPNNSQLAASTAMLAQFFAEWRDGINLAISLQRAKQNAAFPLDPSAVIFGATNLYRFYQY